MRFHSISRCIYVWIPVFFRVFFPTSPRTKFHLHQAIKMLASRLALLSSHLSDFRLRSRCADGSAVFMFPYHRCSDYASTSLPYVLSSPVDTPGDPGMYCMTLTYKGDVSNPSDCYDVLSNQGGTSLIMGVSE